MRFLSVPLTLCTVASLALATSNSGSSSNDYMLLRRTPTNPRDQIRLPPINPQGSPPRQVQPNAPGGSNQSRLGSPTKSAELRIAEDYARRARRLRVQAQRTTPPGVENDDRAFVQSIRHEGARHQSLANAYDKAARVARAAGRPDRVQRNELKSASAKAGAQTMAALETGVQTSNSPRARQQIKQTQGRWEQLRRDGGKDTDSSSQDSGSVYGSSSDTESLSSGKQSVQ